MSSAPNFEALFLKIMETLRPIRDQKAALQTVCEILVTDVPHYDWVGFYLVEPDSSRELALGPFEGAKTEHLRIAFGEGICGQAAEKEEIFVVPDVSRETNYLSCSPEVRSEIVIPIFKAGKLWGELDIDSHQVAAFSKKDEIFLNRVTELLGKLI